MCVMSMVIDRANKYLEPFTSPPPFTYPQNPFVIPNLPYTPLFPGTPSSVPAPSPKPSPEVLKFLEDLIKDAKAYDVKNNEPECEMESKKATLKKLADQLGVKISIVGD